MSEQSIAAGAHIGHVHLKVADLDRAVAFYHDVLGFDLVTRFGRQAAFLSAGGYHHHLGTNTWSPGPSASDDQARLIEWELVVPSAWDSADVAGSLGRAGFETRTENGTWTVRDPWGTQLRIAARM